MSDIFSKNKRSEIMSKVRSKRNNSTELALIKVFNNHGITGWRREYKVKGHPDFVFLDKKIAIFVDGCFWHGHDCRNTLPEQNKEYWQEKRKKNIERDLQTTRLFEKRGWIVIRIWECELKKKNEEMAIEKIKQQLDN